MLMLINADLNLIQILFVIGVILTLTISVYLCWKAKCWKPLIWWTIALLWGIWGVQALIQPLRMRPDGTDFFYTIFSLKIRNAVGYLLISMICWFRGLLVLLKKKRLPEQEKKNG